MRWALTLTSDVTQMTAKRGDFSPRFFRPRAHVPGARYFHYTIPHAICQEKKWLKDKKYYFPILCILHY